MIKFRLSVYYFWLQAHRRSLSRAHREARYPNLTSIELFLYQDKRTKKIRCDFFRSSALAERRRRTFSTLNLMVFATFFAGLREPQSPKKSRVCSQRVISTFKTMICEQNRNSVPFGDFYISVSRLRSIHLKGIERSREARYPNLTSIELFLYQDKRTILKKTYINKKSPKDWGFFILRKNSNFEELSAPLR